MIEQYGIEDAADAVAEMAFTLQLFFKEADINVIYDMPSPVCDALFEKLKEASQKQSTM